MSIIKIKNYLKENTVPADNSKRMCIDGRYGLEQTPGAIATPGADLGYVSALLALSKQHSLNLSPEQCFNMVFDAVVKNGGKLYMHTGHHAVPISDLPNAVKKPNDSQPLIDCGHQIKQTDPNLATQYRINPQDARQLIYHAVRRFLEEKESPDPRIVLIDLSIPDHVEQSVIVIKGTKKTLTHSSAKNEQVFIYDAKRDIQFRREIFSRLPVDQALLSEYEDICDRQRQATLEILAKGKSIFEINLDEENPEVKFIAVI